MRVGIIADSYPAQTFIERHTKGLDADLIVPYRKLPASLDSLGGSAKIYALHCEPPNAERFIGKVARRLRETMSDMRVRPWSVEMEAFFERYVDERKPDVVLAEFAPNGLQALNACRRHRIPLVVHFHGYDASSLLRFRGYVSQLPELFDTAAAVIAVSRRMADTLVRLACPQEKLSIIPCGAPVGSMPSALGARGDCRFITVGRLIPVKGVLLVIRAFALCRTRTEAVRLTMIGDGPLRKRAMRLARRLGVAEKVAFLGRQPFGVVVKELRRSHVFLQHSVTTKLGHIEGWGVAAAEAQAVGLPVIGTDHGGLPDQIVDGKTGYLVPEGDWRAMADRMIELAKDGDLRERMGRAATAHIRAVGDSSKQIDKLRTLLERCVTRSLPSRDALAG